MIKNQFKHVLVVHHLKSPSPIKRVRSILAQHNLKATVIYRSAFTPQKLKNKELVIIIGGDGTFLRATQRIRSTPVLAVSIDRKISESFFSQAVLKNFSKVIQHLLQGKYTIKKLPRLQAKVKGKVVGVPAINEFFIGNKEPHFASYYTLCVGRKKEWQRSSGVLVYTSAGSYAWAGTKKGSLFSSSFYFTVREAYAGRLHSPSLTKGRCKKTQTLSIISNSDRNIFVADSASVTHPLRNNTVLNISVSPHFLSYVVLKTKLF